MAARSLQEDDSDDERYYLNDKDFDTNYVIIVAPYSLEKESLHVQQN